jgi:hypothetical protein
MQRKRQYDREKLKQLSPPRVSRSSTLVRHPQKLVCACENIIFQLGLTKSKPSAPRVFTIIGNVFGVGFLTVAGLTCQIQEGWITVSIYRCQLAMLTIQGSAGNFGLFAGICQIFFGFPMEDGGSMHLRFFSQRDFLGHSEYSSRVSYSYKPGSQYTDT